MLRKLLEVLLIIFVCASCKSSVDSDGSFESKSQAQFAFQFHEKKLVTKPAVEVIFVEYPFINNTQETIDIVEYDAPCTCMGASLRRPDGKKGFRFKPGEKGVVIGKLKLENFTGTIVKKIWIRTSNDLKGKPSISLTAQVTIPTLIEQSQSSLFWKKGSELTAQEVLVKVNQGATIKLVRHSLGYGADAYFRYKVETLQEGQLYKVTVTPKKLNTPVLGILQLYTDSKIGRYKLVQIYLTVSNKKPKEIPN